MCNYLIIFKSCFIYFQDWEATTELLSHFGDNFPERRNAEAKLLMQGIKIPFSKCTEFCNSKFLAHDMGICLEIIRILIIFL